MPWLFNWRLIEQHLGALPRDTAHPDRNYDQRLLFELRTSIRLADYAGIVFPCRSTAAVRAGQLDALLSDILDQIEPSSPRPSPSNISRTPLVSREVSGMREEPGT